MRSFLQNNLKRHILKKVSLFLFILFSIFFVYDNVFAYEFTSSSYKVIDPVIAPAGFSTSSNFQLLGTISETAVGTSSSVSYKGSSGFLNFPTATKPVISLATPWDTFVTLTWTPSSSYNGWIVSSYSVGKSETSGGPYTYTNVGNVTTYNETGLVNGTPYYFVVVANDFFGNPIATSDQSMAIPVLPTITFNISSNAVYFGALSSAVSLYASSTNTEGSSNEVEAHLISVTTNAVNGYTITVKGSSLTSQQNPSNIISPIGEINTPPMPGTKQFGLRAIADGGNGSVASLYGDSGFAYAANATTSSEVASSLSGNNIQTTFSIRYVGNREGITEAGDYSTDLTYLITANF